MTNRKLAYIVKDQKPLVLAAHETVQHACRSMRERNAGSVLVIDDQQRLRGIFTGRDAVRILAEGKDTAVTTLAQAMTLNPVTITPESRAIDALRTMSDAASAIFRSSKMKRSGASFRAAISKGWRSINWTRKATYGNASADDLVGSLPRKNEPLKSKNRSSRLLHSCSHGRDAAPSTMTGSPGTSSKDGCP